MANVFNSVQLRKPKRNKFNMSYAHKTTVAMGTLVPTLLQECVPGDTFSIRTDNLIRFQPLVTPVMHEMNVFMHYFFVPNRIVFPLWEDFISADLSKQNPPAWPHFNLSGTAVNKGELLNYLGLPIKSANAGNLFVSAIPAAGYQAIWNEYYRDQNLQPEFNYTLTAGQNSIGPSIGGIRSLRRRAWQHDYFTASLPFQQKGPAVGIPVDIEGEIPVRTNRTGSPNPYSQWANNLTGDTHNIRSANQLTDNPAVGPDYLYGVFTPSSVSSVGTINDLRTALRLQEFFEKAARGGSRYVEQLLVHFGVRSSDKRLQRPEFIGGSMSPVIISEVLQTSSTDSTSPQANMAGHGISAGRGKSVKYYCEEHGYIFGIMSIMPKTGYMQGVDRHWFRTSWDEYMFPTFAHLGEQPVYNKELYLANDNLNDEVFGYLPRYTEYRYNPSRSSGEMADTLKNWHLDRFFTNRPNLNAQFIECTPRTDIFAVTGSADQLIVCADHKIFAKRTLPKYGTPTL